MALLHIGRLVLNMSKYLIRLSNTSANDHQRVRVTQRPPCIQTAVPARPKPPERVPVDQNIRSLSGEQAPPVVAPLEPRDRPFGERADAVEFERIEAQPVLDQTVGGEVGLVIAVI